MTRRQNSTNALLNIMTKLDGMTTLDLQTLQDCVADVLTDREDND